MTEHEQAILSLILAPSDTLVLCQDEDQRRQLEKLAKKIFNYKKLKFILVENLVEEKGE